jgi:spore germination protein KB
MMNQTSASINVLQLTMLIITVVGIQDHVIITPALLESAGRDSWVAVLLAGAVVLIWLGMVYFIMKRTKQANLVFWISKHVGKIPAMVVILLICVDLFIGVFVTLKDTSDWTNASYLISTPNFVIELSIVALCFFGAYAGIEAIAIANGILLPVVVLLGHLVMLGNMPRKDYTFLFPVLQNGLEPLLKGMLYAGSGFVEVLAVLFLQHHLKSSMRFLPLFLTGCILILLTFGPITGAIAAFGPEIAQQLRYPAFEQWRLLILAAGYIDKADFLSIYQWLTGTFIRISVGLFLIVEILNLSRKKTWALISLSLILLILSQIPISDIEFWRLLYNILLPVSFGIMFIISLLLLVFVLWKEPEKQKG